MSRSRKPREKLGPLGLGLGPDVTPGASDADRAVERCLVGGFMAQPWRRADVPFDQRDVYSRSLSRVLEAIDALLAAGSHVDAVLVQAELERTGHLAEAGGVAGLAELVQVGGEQDLASHAAHVREAATRRSLMRALDDAANIARDRAAPDAIEQAQALMAGVAARAGRSALVRPKIVAGSQVKELVDQAERAVAAAHEAGHVEVYQRSGQLVRLAERHGVPRLEPIPLPSVLELLSHVASWVRVRPARDGEGTDEVPCKPPREVVEALAERGRWPALQELAAVSHAPVMRPDGTVHATPGHDAATRTLFRPRCTFPDVPERPTRDDARAALAELVEPLCDFSFREPSDRSAALALTLTLVGRRAIAGPTPMTIVGGTTPGAGKSLVVDVAHAIATGGARTPRMVQADRGSTGEEEKRMLALCLEGVPIALFDNVDRPIGSAVLDAALTGDTFRGRLLGASRVVDAPVPVLAASGNNVTVRGDLPRRVVVCDLATDVERPEERSGFRFPNVLEHVRAHRPRLLVAALTVLRAYVVAGRPAVGLPSFGSFEAWSDLVRSALVWLGEADPLAGQARLREAGDPRVDGARHALAAWRDVLGSEPITLADVSARARRADAEDLRDALAALSRKLDPEALDARVLADELARFSGRILGGLRLERLPGRTKRGVLWRVVAPGAAPATALEVETREPELELAPVVRPGFTWNPDDEEARHADAG